MAELRKEPRHGDLVIAVVSKITHFGAYCRLSEYGDIEAFLPIREVSSGWIKNIREHIHDGQKLVCFVNYVDREKGTIDISLKKVSTRDSKEKIRSYNLERRLGALFSQTLKITGDTKGKDALSGLLISEFGSYTKFMENAVSGTAAFSQSKLPTSVKDAFLRALEANRKQKQYIVAYIATITTYNTKSGAAELREIMRDIKGHGIGVTYIAAPKYRLVSEGKDYADAEEKINEVKGLIGARMKNGVFEIEKEKLKKEKEDIMSTI
jgi:translation initiation factor 2 alpha subunit (eIF-2alpha)